MRSPLADRAIVSQSVRQSVEWWDGNPTEVGRPDGSALHKLVEAWQAGIVVFPRSAERDRPLMEELILGRSQVFLVEHDWAGLVGRDVDLRTVEYRTPFERCALEFNISGHRVIHFEDETLGVMLALLGGRHWTVFPMGRDYSLPEGRETGLPGVLQLTAETVRAMSIVLEAGVADAEYVAAAVALNKARARSGKVPLSDYHVIRVPNSRPTGGRDHDGGSSTPGVRLHFRRGHYRHLNDRKTWIRWTLAGNPDLGFVDKRYRL